MSENLWTFCLFATYPKKMTTYPFFMVGIAFVVYLLDILDLQDIKMKKLIKVVVNVLSIMAGSTSCICKRFFFHLITVLHLDSDSIFNIIEL